MVKIVTLEVITVKVGVLYILFQGKISVEILIKEGEMWLKTAGQMSLKYNFWGGRFHMLPQSYKFSYVLCLNHLIQVWLIGNKKYQVPPFRYINKADGVSHF